MNANVIPEPIGLVKKSEWAHYRPNADLATGARCVKMLKAAGFDAVEDPNFNWLIDTFPMLTRMFPDGCPPVTIISQNQFFEPHFHVAIGRALRPLRKEGYLFIGSGGGVHNLYRVHWNYNWRYRDTFAQELPPEGTHLEFRQALEDVLCKNGGGPEMKRAVVRLMKHPHFRDAHGTDEHFMPFCFAAGVVGEEEDRAEPVVLAAEVWELVSILQNSLTAEYLVPERDLTCDSRLINVRPNSPSVNGNQTEL
jgi:aromatic ring-opening dioxygenase catalytic subunit (LigB family)